MVKSRCGIVCDPVKCKEAFKVDCPGCVAIDKPFWGVCDVKVCCEGKGLEHCGLCPDFPCGVLTSYAYNEEHGNNGEMIEQCKKWAITARASELINSKTDYIGEGMGGYAVVSLNGENGYPTSSTMTISKADGINWLSFLSSTNGTKAQRIAKSNKACVCLASSEYHISLVGTMEVITDPMEKKEHWQEVATEFFKSDWNDPQWCVLKFTAETYNIFFADNDSEAKGKL